jgi:oxygen-dependent protoporphyrinogen oxidase
MRLDHPEATVNVTTDVLVVGGGPAGLAAAYRLRQAGAEVRVLEASEQLGGKMRSAERDGFLVDQGAFFLPTTHRALLGLATELGMAEDIVPGGFVLGVVRDGVIHTIDGNHPVRDLLRTRLVSNSSKLALVRLLPELIRARRATYQRMPECGRYDTGTLLEWSRTHLNEELREFVADAVMRGIFATTAETSPRVDFLAILALLRGARLVAFRGGMGSYARRLARDLKSEVRAEVIEVEERADSVRVTWRDGGGVPHSQQVDGCVVATPAQVTRRLVSKLDPWRAEFLRRVRHGTLLVLNLGLSRSPDGVTATYLLVPHSAHPFITGVMLDHHKAPGRAPEGKALLSVAVLDSWSEHHRDEDDETLIRTVLAGLETLLPGVGATVEFAELQRWYQEFNRVGFYRDLGRFRQLCQRDHRVHLAGDLRSMSNLDAATRSGEQAARALIAAIGLGHSPTA